MKITKLFTLLTAASLFIAALSGCSQSTLKETTAASQTEAVTNETEAAADPNQTQGAKTNELTEIDLVLDWYPNALHAFIYTAIERGYYAQEGLQVNVRFPSNSNDALSLVAAGKAQIGLYYQHDIIQAVANQNIGIKSIGAVVQSPLNVILSLSEAGITRPADMQGKTIGYGGTALSEAIVKTMVEGDGADFSDVKLIDVGFDLMSSMTTNNVDATIGCLINHEVPQLEEEGFDVNYFLVTGYGIPNYYEAVFLASTDDIENNPEMLASFLRASKKGFNDFASDPEACLKILLDNQNEENFPLSETVEQKSCQTLLPLMQTDEAAFLSQSDACWQENIDWMLNSGLIDQGVSVDDVRVNISFE